MLSRMTGQGACAEPGTLLRPLTRLSVLLCALLTLAVCVCEPALAQQRTGPTVREVVEFTRIVQPRDADPDQLQEQVSRDGKQAFIVTRKADTSTNRNHYRILLLDVRPQYLAAGRVAAPVAVASFDAEYDNDSAYPALQDARWVDARTIVFRGRVKGTAFQVWKVDIQTRRLEQLTFAPLGVVSYAVSDDLRRVVYTAPHPNPAMAPDARSVVVGNQSFWSVKFGAHDMRAQQRRYQYFVTDSGAQGPARALGESFAEASAFVPSVSISPDGQWALVPRFEPERQLAWEREFPLVADAATRFGPSLTNDPLAYFSRPGGYVPRRLVAYRLSDGQEQTVLDAPDDSLPGAGQARSDRLWQDGGRSVVIAGTFLPRKASVSRADASYIVEYWPDSKRWEVIAALNGRLTAALP